MLFRNILLSFILCTVITGISIAIVRPGSVTFFPTFILQGATYGIMALIVLVLLRMSPTKSSFNFILAFLLSYAFLILSAINGVGFADMISRAHVGKGFFFLLLPFLLANAMVFLWAISRQRCNLFAGSTKIK